MADRKMVADESEDKPKETEVLVGSIVTRKLVDPADDPFLNEAEVIKTYDGLSPSFKRSTTRSLQKMHQSRTGDAKSKKEEVQILTGYAMFDVVTPPYNLDYLAKLNEISPPHYAAIKAKVANIVGLGYDFIESSTTKRVLEDLDEEATKAKRKKIAKAKEEVYDWLDSCNQDDEFIETLIKVWTDYETTGNGYLEIGRTTGGNIGYLGHIPATTMRIRKQRDGFVQIIANKAVFFRNFGDKRTTNPTGADSRPNEVIHIKKYAPTNNYYGIPDIIAAQAAVAGAEFASRFNLDYFENKAVPRYVIVIKGGTLSSNSQRQILEFFQTNLKGKNHRTLYVPLPADEEGKKASFEMKPVEAGTQDSSFNNYDKGNLSKVLMVHRVPISKVGLAEGVSLAVARDADKTFKEQVCRPEQSIFEKKLNKIIKEKTNLFLLKLNELTLTDEDTVSKMDERYLRWGVILPNEVRARWGWNGIEGGDKPVGIIEQLELQAGSQEKQTKMQIDSSEKTAEMSAKATETAAAKKPAAGAGAAEQKSQQNASRTRDANRSANASDTSGEARKPKGEGRAQS